MRAQRTPNSISQEQALSYTFTIYFSSLSGFPFGFDCTIQVELYVLSIACTHGKVNK